MRHHTIVLRAALVLGAVTLAASACRKEPAAPELQRTTGVEQRAQPVTVAGCLKSGIAEDTFVLMATQAGAGETSTYQLTGHDTVDLKSHVGEQVEVSGTLQAQQQTASTSGAVAEKPARGTSGTPVVETKTEVDVKRLDVSSIKPLGNRCQS
jgi:hypothetical protein